MSFLRKGLSFFAKCSFQKNSQEYFTVSSNSFFEEGEDISEVAKLIDLSSSYIRAQCLVVGIKIGVFEYFEDEEPIDSDLFFTERGMDCDFGFRLFRALSALGTLKHHGNRDFSISDVGCYLRKDSDIRIGDLILHQRSDHSISSYLSEPFIEMLEHGNETTSFSLQNDGMKIWQLLLDNVEESNHFNEAMRTLTHLDTPNLMELLIAMDNDGVFDNVETFSDIGGGTGAFAELIVSLKDNIKVTILDIPAVVEEKDGLIKHERIDFVECDMFDSESILENQDIYSFKNVLFDWYDQEVLQILQNVYEKAKVGSTLMICENILPEIVTPENGFGVFLDIHFLTVVGGKERTLNEYKKLFDQSGWSYTDIYEGNNRFRKGVILGMKK